MAAIPMKRPAYTKRFAVPGKFSMLSIACLSIQGARRASPSVKSIYIILPVKPFLCLFKYFKRVFSSLIFSS